MSTTVVENGSGTDEVQTAEPSVYTGGTPAIAVLVADMQQFIPSLVAGTNGAYAKIVIDYEGVDTIRNEYYYAQPVERPVHSEDLMNFD